jgi:DEAD/DEAH box helicase domain-containing protein
MDMTALLKQLQQQPDYRDQIVHVHQIDARPPLHAQPHRPLHPQLQQWLAQNHIEQLWSHQAAAIDAATDGRDIVVVTGTASGKTMCYNLPVAQAMLESPQARAMYIFPAKALAQDQLATLQSLARCSGQMGDLLRPATYDGDTPTYQRRKIRTSGSVILTNPDMLHQAILPQHGRWGRFLAELRFIVLDEIHTYRGIFGSHVAGVLRRLQRICQHYGSQPQYICCSATIANPVELAGRLIGRQVELIDNDGSPRGRKSFVLWNPPLLERQTFQRRSANVEAQQLMRQLILRGVQTITFAKARIVAELIYRYLRNDLEQSSPALAGRVKPYRGGYLPQERREIEKQLFSGQLLGVCSTNALELGIDVGSLDAAIIVGFPGTICSTWQQAGRAGRSSDESLAVLMAYDDPIDQYLMRHPEYFFDRNHENAVIDPENCYILAAQLACAAAELPVGDEDSQLFGDQAITICDQQNKSKDENTEGWWQDESTGRFHYHQPHAATAASKVSLRTISPDTYAIVETTEGKNNAKGQVDSISAPELVYPNAIYLHEGDAYIVRDLDTDAKIAYIERAEVDYYTQPVLHSSCRITATRYEESFRQGQKCFGDLDVTWQTTAFKKIKYYTMEMIGQSTLDLPAQNIETTGLWLSPPNELLAGLARQGYRSIDALAGLRNLMLAALPVLAMCDRRDISGLIDSSNLGRPAVFMYDRYPGGLGFSQKGYELLDELLEICRNMVTDCPCQDGCPSCVGLAQLRPPLHQDPDIAGGYPIPSKSAAMLLLTDWE